MISSIFRLTQCLFLQPCSLKSLWDSRGAKEPEFFSVVPHHVHGVVGAEVKRPPCSKSVCGELLLWDRVGRARERLSDLEAFE